MRPQILDYVAQVAALHRDALPFYAAKSPPLADPPEEGDGDGVEHEPNTYGLPEGEPIARKLKAWFARQLAKLTGWLGRWGKPKLPKSLPSLDAFTKPMAKAFAPVLGKYWQEAGQKLLDAVGQPEASWDVTDPHLAAKIDGASLAFCASTNATTTKTIEAARLALKAELKAGLVDRGEAIPELAKRVRKVYEHLSDSHATMIARTESSRAVHAAQLESAVQSGVVVGKRLLLAANACLKICVATKKKEPKEGWPLDAVMYDDGQGNPHYSKSINVPLHPHDRCSMSWVIDPDLDLPAGTFSGIFLDQP